MQKPEKRIVLTGGHGGTTALAIVEEIKRQNLFWKIYWIGPRYSVEGKKEESMEFGIFSQEGIIVHSLFSGRIQRKFSFWTIPSILKIPFGFIHAFSLLLKIKPLLILSLGGFAGFPVVIAGKMLGIPVIVHEQTSCVGRANRLSSLFADRILLARESSLKYFPDQKSLVVGNPILSFYFQEKLKPNLNFPPTLFITGGSRGSRFINGLLAKSLGSLLLKYKVIHQVGPFDFNEIETLKGNLGKEMSSRYEIKKMILPQEMISFYRKADIVVARAGANTVSELIALKKPTIFIPIPWSYLGEQKKNAEYAERFGIAKVLQQDGLSGDKLVKETDDLFKNMEKIRMNVKNKKSPDEKASTNVVNVLKEFVK